MIILTKDEAAKINAGNIKKIFNSARDILLERQRMYAEYECKDFEELFTPIPKYAVDIAAGYFIGSPCKYYCQTNTVVKKISDIAGRPRMRFEDVANKSKGDEAYLNRYRAILRRNHEDEENIVLAKNALICGTAYERLYATTREGLVSPHFKSIDPRKCIMFHDATVERNPTAFIMWDEFFSLVENRKVEQYELITQDRWVKYVFEGGNVTEIDSTDHEKALLRTCGIPVIEFPMPERESYFKKVLPLVHARNALLNNLRNTFKYNDEAILLMIGYMAPETEEENEQFKDRIEKFKTLYLGEDNKVEWLIKQVDIESVGGYFNFLTDDIFAMLGQTNPTKIAEVYQNIQAVRYQNYGMDNTVIALERSFEKSLLEGRAQKITSLMNEGTKNAYNWEVLDVTFTRNIPSSAIEEVQFMTQAKASGLLADKDILDMVSFVEDSEAAHQRKLEQDRTEAEETERAISNVRTGRRDGEKPKDGDNQIVPED